MINDSGKYTRSYMLVAIPIISFIDPLKRFCAIIAVNVNAAVLVFPATFSAAVVPIKAFTLTSLVSICGGMKMRTA